MRAAEIVTQVLVAKPGLGEMLNPFNSARREIRSGAQARLLLQYFLGNVAHLEGEARFVILPAADSKDLAANFPDVRSAPLNHVRGCGKCAAEFVEFLVGQLAPTFL